MLGSKKLPENLDEFRVGLRTSELLLLSLLLLLLSSCGKPPTAEFRDGEKLLSQGKYPEAAKSLEKAARALETNVDAWNKLGLALQYQNKLLEAQSAYKNALKIDSTFPDTHYNIGNLYLDMNELEDAVKHLQNYTFMVQEAHGYLALAIAQRRSGQLNEALVSLKAAEAIDPQDLTIKHEMALAYYEDNKPDVAMRHLSEIMGANSEFAPAILTMAIISQNLTTNLTTTIDYYERYLALNPPEEKAKQIRAILDSFKPQETVEEPADSTNDVAENVGTTNTIEIVKTDVPTDDPGKGEIEVESSSEKIEDNPPITDTLDPRVTTSGLSKPKTQIKPETIQLKPSVPKAYGFSKKVKDKEFLLIPVNPEPAVYEMEPAADIPLNYPYEEIQKLLQANKQVLAAYGLSMPKNPEELPSGFYRDKPIPEGITPLEPLPLPDKESLIRLTTGNRITISDSQPVETTEPEVVIYTPPPAENTNRIEVVRTTGNDGNLGVFESGAGTEIETIPEPQALDLAFFPRYQFQKPPTPAEGDRYGARPFFLDGVQAYKSNQLPLAINFFEDAARKDPAYFEAHFNLGVLYLQANLPEKSMPALERAQSVRPDNLEINYHMGKALNELGNIRDAVEQFEKVVADNPNHIGAHFGLAKVYEEKVKDLSKAAVHYKRIIEIQPDHPESTNIRYWLKARSK